jgi:hypothetical protein
LSNLGRNKKCQGKFQVCESDESLIGRELEIEVAFSGDLQSLILITWINKETPTHMRKKIKKSLFFIKPNVNK